MSLLFPENFNNNVLVIFLWYINVCSLLWIAFTNQKKEELGQFRDLICFILIYKVVGIWTESRSEGKIDIRPYMIGIFVDLVSELWTLRTSPLEEVIR